MFFEKFRDGLPLPNENEGDGNHDDNDEEDHHIKNQNATSSRVAYFFFGVIIVGRQTLGALVVVAFGTSLCAALGTFEIAGVVAFRASYASHAVGSTLFAVGLAESRVMKS